MDIKHYFSQQYRYKIKQLVFAFLVGSLVSFSASAQEYQLIDLGTDVTPKDINNSGTIAGTYLPAPYTPVAFRYTTAAGLEDITRGTVANGVNDSELITGNTSTGAFLFDGKLNDLGDDYSGLGINDIGNISGSKAGTNPYRTSPKPVNPAIYDAALGQWKVLDVARVYSRGTRQGVYADIYALADINDNGFAVGSKRRAGITGSSAIMTTPAFDVVTFLPIPNGGYATAINNQNYIVGTSGNNTYTNEYAHAFLYDGATVTDLGTLNGGLTSAAMDINELNQVVGSSWLSPVLTSLYEPEKYHAFIWENGQMTDLNSLIPANSGWILTSATAINDNGDIVGTALLGGQVHGFLLTAPQQAGQAPVAVANANILTGKAPLSINFSASESYDPDGTIVSYQWGFGDGASSSEANPSHTYAEPGTYTATLFVTDNQGLTGMTQLTITATERKSKGRVK